MKPKSPLKKLRSPAVAAVDVGSNATRLVITVVSSSGVLLAQEQQRYALRLGSDVFAHGHVSAAKQKALIEIFCDIQQKMRQHGVRTYRAVATSALREAQNGVALLQPIYQHSGLNLQIISGAQESKLARAALLRSVGGAAPETLLLDLGGGSLELERAGDASRRGRSVQIGSVRLLQMLPQLRSAMLPDALAAARQAVRQLVRQNIRATRTAPDAIGTGGSLDALTQLLPVAGARLPMVDLARLLDLAQKAASLPVAARQRLFAVRPDRADLMLPALLILLELVELFDIRRLVVPGSGLRDALLHQLWMPSDAGAAMRRILGHGNEIVRAADKSARLAQELFDDLAAVHKLWPPALQPLLTALYAWYVGSLLQPKAAAKHARYVLEELDNADLDAESRAVALYAIAQLAPPAAATQRAKGSLRGAALHAAQVLAGLLQVVIHMAPQGRRTEALDVDLLHEPIVISADLSAPLAAAQLRPLAAALQRQIVVR